MKIGGGRGGEMMSGFLARSLVHDSLDPSCNPLEKGKCTRDLAIMHEGCKTHLFEGY